MINKNLHCFVYGRVQGVGFRKWIKTKSLEYSLKGWVKNCKDGRVELEISGQETLILEFIKILKKGSFFSKVEKIEYSLKRYKIFKEFIVLPS